MIRAAIIFVVLFSVFLFIAERSAEHTAAAAKLETLTCVRAKEVTPAGTINYLCEVKNAKPQ